MEIHEHIDHLASEGGALTAAAGRADLDAAVPPCPDWVVRDLLAHIGGVHRWATEIVGRALPGPETPNGEAVGTAPADGDLVAWLGDGYESLVRVLRAAPADLACFSFLPAPSPLAFWARRQALETAVHRVDLESASGSAAPLDAALALDGIEEMLIGFGGRPKPFTPGVMRLEPGDGAAWEVTLGPDGASAAVSTGVARVPDVTVTGSASEVYLWLWNRSADVTMTGDAAIAEQWNTVRVRWG